MKKYLIHIIAILFLALSITECLHAQKNLTQPTIEAPNGFSVNSFTGGLKFKRQDIYIQGIGPDLNFEFKYGSSSKKKDKGFGYGWKFTYQIYYTLEDDVISVKGVEGGSRKFFKNGQDWTAEKGVFDLLTEYEPNKFKMTSKDGTIHFFEDSTYKQITKVEDRCTNQMTFAYADSLLTEVTDQGGRSIQLSWTDGHLTKVTNDLLAETREYVYEYDDNDNLVKVTNPLGYYTEYIYDERHRLIQMLDENNTPTLISYQKSGGVKQISSCDFAMSITYNVPQNRVYVVQQSDGERIITTYQFDPAGRIESKEGNCCGYNVAYLYDDDNNVSRRTDGNGNEKLYSFDDRGNRTSKTDAGGQIESFSFEPAFNQVTNYVDQAGAETKYTYDSKGNVTLVEKPLGIIESFTYDNVGNLLSQTDGNNNTTTYEYNAYGYMILIIHPDGSTKSFEYDAIGSLMSQQDERGNSSSIEYDLLNRPIKTVNALGYETSFVYDGRGNLIELIDSNGKSTTYTYSGLNQRLSTTTPEGIVTKTEYDNRGNIKATIDGNGNRTTYKYNIRNQLVEQTDALGLIVSFEYDAIGNKISQSDKMGNFMTYEYDNNSRLIKQVNPLGSIFSFSYDARGRKIEEVDARGNSTHHEYDLLGRKVKSINSLGYEIEYTYDAVGNKTSKKDENGNIYTFEYDNRNRKTLTTNPLQYTTEHVYDSYGNILQLKRNGEIVHEYVYNQLNQKINEISPLGETDIITYDSIGNVAQNIFFDGTTISFNYDSDNRLISKADNYGVFESYVYDDNNVKIQQTNSQGVTSIFHFDEIGRLIEMENPSGGMKKFEYDANGNMTKQIDEKQNEVAFVYNAIGQVIEAINTLNDKTFFEFDENGNQVSISDCKANTTNFVFDKLNRQTNILYPNGTSRIYIYDGVGNIVEKKDPAGNSSIYTYNQSNEQILKSYSDGTSCSFSYDDRGRMINATNVNTQIEFQYDVNNRITSETINGSDIISYSYDPINLSKQITYPSGRSVSHYHDYRGRPSTVIQNSDTIATFEFQNGYLVNQLYPNGMNATYSHNIEGEVSNIAIGLNNEFNINYKYDELKNRTSEELLHHPEFSRIFEYDNANRLTSFSQGTIINELIPNPINSMIYDLDALGNRNTVSSPNNTTNYQVDQMNAYTQVTDNGVSIATNYSTNGNMIFDGLNAFEYDFENRLVSVNDSISYEYDALGRRFKKNVGNSSVKYLYAGKQMIHEEDSNGDIKEHIYSSNIDHLLSTIKNNSEQIFYHYDAIGSVIGISDDSGQVLERYQYDTYGKVYFFDNAFSSLTESNIDNNFFFTGKEYDKETGLYFFRTRYFSPDLGRFIQRDPASYVDGMNMYQYVKSNPIKYIDEDGLYCNEPVHIKLDFKNFDKDGSFVKYFEKNDIDLEGNIFLSFKTLNCFECCEENKDPDRPTFEYNITAGGFVSVHANLAGKIPGAGWVVQKAADRLGVELFLGFFINGSINGHMFEKLDPCGNVTGGGCVNGLIGGGFKGSFDKELTHKYQKPDFIRGGASVAGEYSINACMVCDGSSCEPECEWNANLVASAWFQVEVNFPFLSYEGGFNSEWEIIDGGGDCSSWFK